MKRRNSSHSSIFALARAPFEAESMEEVRAIAKEIDQRIPEVQQAKSGHMMLAEGLLVHVVDFQLEQLHQAQDYAAWLIDTDPTRQQG